MQRNEAILCLMVGTAVPLLACDRSAFEYRVAAPATELDASAVRAGAASQSAVHAENAQSFGSVGSANDPAVVSAGGGGAAARDAKRAGPMDGGAVTDNTDVVSGTSSAGNGPSAGSAGTIAATHGAAPTPCPQLPTDEDETFCYDFESGVNGPSRGDIYDLWTTPAVAIANQLSAVAQPGNPKDHVLQTRPSLSASEPTAALSHSTFQFERATVEFDIWVDAMLANTTEEVSWFRYVPIDGNYERVSALVFRRGQALLRSESDSAEYPLTAQPRTDGTATHVSVLLDRHGPCSTKVWIDGALAASSSEGACVSDFDGFVEFGLIMAEGSGAPFSAYYDNIAFTRR